jgi:hypothetical protein
VAGESGELEGGWLEGRVIMGLVSGELEKTG